jgi:hypothetical protein
VNPGDRSEGRQLGRLLAEFEASLSAGGEAASQSVLDQLSAQGGITATNLAYLRIKRLDCLGRSEDLLSMPGLADAMRQDPPLPVKEAVLNAIYSTALEEPLLLGNVAAACASLRDADRPLPVPSHDPVTLYGEEAAAVLITAAVGRRDKPALENMAAAMQDAGRTGTVPRPLWEEVSSLLQRPDLLVLGTAGDEAPVPEPSPLRAESDVAEATDAGTTEAGNAAATSPEVTDILVPASWPALFDAIAQDAREARTVLRDEVWKEWSSPAGSDAEIKRILDALDNVSWERVWQLAGRSSSLLVIALLQRNQLALLLNMPSVSTDWGPVT